MAETIIALIRHGEYAQLAGTPSAHQLGGLSHAGQQQAKACADLIKQAMQTHGWRLAEAVHSSSLRRAWQTASLCCEALAHRNSIVQTDALCERSVGAAANLSLAQIERLLGGDERFGPLPEAWKSDSQFRLPVPGAESLLDAGQRVADYIDEQLRLCPSGESRLHLYFGHGAAFRHAACLLGVLDLDQVKSLSMHHARPVFLRRRVDGRFEHIAGEWKPRQGSMTD